MAEDPLQSKTNPLGPAMMEGLREIIGQAGINAVLNLSGRAGVLEPGLPEENDEDALELADLSGVQAALEALYGPRGGRGIALRAGRAALKYLFRRYEEAMGLTSLDYRLLPTQAKIKTGLRAFGLILPVELSEDEIAFYWKVLDCPVCEGRQVDAHGQGVCQFVAGMLQEFVAWASSGRVYSVYETECAAEGFPGCLFRIEKQPLD